MSSHTNRKARKRLRNKRLQENGPFEFFTFLEIYDRDKGICQICKKSLSRDTFKTSLDHIIPISKGGTHTRLNIQLSCRPCNEAKGDKFIMSDFLDGIKVSIRQICNSCRGGDMPASQFAESKATKGLILIGVRHTHDRVCLAETLYLMIIRRGYE